MKCECKANLLSKVYPDGIGNSLSPGGFLNAFKRHTRIQADYDCRAPSGKKETLVGTHTASYWVDKDDTLVAWGVSVKHKYNQLLAIEKTVEAKGFDPSKSNVPELQVWAEKNG